MVNSTARCYVWIYFSGPAHALYFLPHLVGNNGSCDLLFTKISDDNSIVIDNSLKHEPSFNLVDKPSYETTFLNVETLAVRFQFLWDFNSDVVPNDILKSLKLNLARLTEIFPTCLVGLYTSMRTEDEDFSFELIETLYPNESDFTVSDHTDDLMEFINYYIEESETNVDLTEIIEQIYDFSWNQFRAAFTSSLIDHSNNSDKLDSLAF